MKPAIDGLCGDAVRQVMMMRAILGKEAEVRRKTDELIAKDEEILQCICNRNRLNELGLRNNFNILMHNFIIGLPIYNGNRLRGLGMSNNFNIIVHSFSRQPLNYNVRILKSSNRQLIAT